jgi:enoyl-CoA hydratase/carnithine racemase
VLSHGSRVTFTKAAETLELAEELATKLARNPAIATTSIKRFANRGNDDSDYRLGAQAVAALQSTKTS